MSVVRKISDHKDYRKQQEAYQPTEKGFALFHRKIMDCGFYKDSQAVHLWFHLVMKATHKPIVSTTEFGDIQLNRGQCITGRHKLASETGIAPDRIQYLLRKFASMEMIGAESNRKFTVITILKYDEYQADYLPTDYQQITNANPHDTKAVASIVPTDSQQITTYNELLTNNLLPKGNKSSSGDDKSPRRKSNSIPYQAIMDAYNSAAGSRLPNAEKLSEKRKREIKKMLGELNEPTIEAAENYFHAFMKRAGQFYFGSNDNGWKANFDYLLRPDTVTKTREGSL